MNLRRCSLELQQYWSDKMVIPTTDALNQSTVMRQIRKLAEIVKTNFEEMLTRFSSKQDKLEAGDGIVINGNVISAPGGGGGTGVTIDDTLSTSSTNPVQNKVITEALNGKQPTGNYQPAGDYPTRSELTTGLAGKQNVLTAGTGISIVNDVISADNVSGNFVEKGFKKCSVAGETTVASLSSISTFIRQTLGSATTTALVIVSYPQAPVSTIPNLYEFIGIYDWTGIIKIIGSYAWSNAPSSNYMVLGGTLGTHNNTDIKKLTVVDTTNNSISNVNLSAGFELYALDLGSGS